MLSCTHLCGNVCIVHCHRHTNSRPPECLCVGEDTMNLQWSSFPIWEIWIGGAVWSILVHVQCLHFRAKYKSVMRKGTFWRLIQNNFTSIWLHLGLNNLATFGTELCHRFPPKPTNDSTDSTTAWPSKGGQVCVRVWQLMLANIKQ